MASLSTILDRNWLLRRINIRQAALIEGTRLTQEVGNKYLKKNRSLYWKWRDEIRQKIDNPMLKRLLPTGTVLRDCMAEIYDGNTTFLRQVGTYPLIVGVKSRIPLRQFYDVKITDHMLRSVVGELL
jgi:radical SAM superfamily enzyme with C-terminal helix-hairpin-helix motif